MQQHTIHFHIRQFCLLLLCLFATEGVMGQTYDYTFTHYPGQVYDGKAMSTLPEGLQYSTQYKTHDDDPRINTGVNFQRTHEYERVVWCMPGGFCDLSPFTCFEHFSVDQYHETYDRWCNYQTGKIETKLSFPQVTSYYKTSSTNITQAVRTSADGHIGGSAVCDNRVHGSKARYTSNEAATSTKDVLDIISWESSVTFTKPSGKALTEPNLENRVLFVIKNAKVRADAMAEDNGTYIDGVRVKLMAPAGTPFQYRMDCYEHQGWGTSAQPTDYWYHDGTTYKQVYHYLIETYKIEDDGTETLLGSTINRGKAATAAIDDMNGKLAYAYKDMKVNEYVDTRDKLDRMIYIKSPEVGNYRIKIYAIENPSTKPSSASNAAKIQVNGHDLELMEYELEFMDAKQGNMIREKELMTNTDYTHQRPAELEKLYGTPTSVVNFDEYSSIIGSKGYSTLPINWESSSYGYAFSYTNYKTSNANNRKYNYNVYILSSSAATVQWNGACKDPSSYNIAEPYDINGYYDRKWHDTQGKEKGLFLYCNGASEPGYMAKLDIGENFCTGTRVFVSAWVMECSNASETANLVFSFKGVDKDGYETTLSSFVTGYVTGGDNTLQGFKNGASNSPDNTNNPRNWGKWMHVYYNFYPKVTDASKYDHFVLTLDNNCVGSSGADYAVDDIRTFVCKPEVKAFQDTPICNGQTFTELRFESDFDILLSALGVKEKSGTNTSTEKFYYCFLDKAIYEKEMEGVTTKEGYQKAFNKALVKDVYQNSEEALEPYCGELEFESNFEKNKAEGDYNKSTDPKNKALSRTETSGTEKKRTLVFPSSSELNDEKMKVNNEYIMAIMSNSSATEVADKFDLTSTCAMSSNIKVASSGQIKIDGQLVSNEDGISVCANQRPTITVDMTGVKEGGEQVSETNTYFDWYMGPCDAAQTAKKESYEEYYTMEAYNGTNLKTAMDHFRYVYPTKTQDDVEKDKFTVPYTKDGTTFTDAELKCIQYFLGQGKIALYKDVDAINTFDRYTNQKVDLDKARSNKIYTTILPINPKPDDESLRFCLEPFEVIMSISDKAPSMKNGDDSGKIPYPKTMRDVPLRIGLKQLQACCTLTDLLNGTDRPLNYLFMPLRDVNPYTATATDLDPRKIDQTNDPHTYSVIGRSEDDLVYLIASNDPDVSMTKSLDKSGARHAVGDENVIYIGQVSDIVASRTSTGNVCHLAFFKNFKFREGYWYTIKFHFEENYSGVPGDHSDVCPGEVLCTIKVVPEYQMWTGAVDGNWNNEANWRRVSKDDLLKTSAATDEYVTDGTTTKNNRETCFVPADFTKVVIPAASTLSNVPTLYDLRGSDNNETVTFTGAPSPSNFIKYMTLEDAQDSLTAEKAKTPKDEGKIAKIEAAIDILKDNYDKDVIGVASDTVNFDMASVDITSGTDAGNVACRAWYDHTCDQIHFNSGAEIIGQQYLHYNKAWADVELDTCRWQTFACPIQNVIAGDFYLPTEPVAGGTYGARQDTPLFEDIYYKPDLNDRFKPAVYQRSWNAKSATIYHADGKTSEATTSGITGNPITLDWSHVYNDANVRYEPGAGSSIKPDVSALPKEKRPAKVKFRFPKADTKYTYYHPDDDDTGSYKDQSIPSACLQDGSRTYRLIDFTDTYVQQIGGSDKTTQGEEGVLNATDTKYFLVGNPFMCHLSMKEFLKANEDNIEPKYWVVTEKGQRVVVMGSDGKVSMTDPNAVGFIGTDATNAEDKLIEPFQSFFVSLKGDAGKVLTPKFTPAMMKATPNVSSDPTSGGGTGGSSNNVKGEMTRSVVSVPESILRISALDNKNHETVMMLTDGEARPTKGAEALFDTNLSDEPMIYSTVKGQAMSIAQILPGDTIPIALMGVRDEVTLKLQGAANFGKPLYLVDAVTGKAQSLDGDITLKQSGNGVRYYLATRALEKDEEEVAFAPLITTKGLHLTAKAPAGMEIEEIHIYAPNGTCVANDEYVGVQYDVTLSQRGIYLIRLVCDGVDYTYKIALQ